MSEPTLTGTAGAALASVVDGVIFDLDGVVYRGPHAVDHAVRAIADLPVARSFVTNNASRTPAQVAGQLRDLGVAAEDGEVTTSAQAAAWYIRREYGPGAKVLMIGGAGLKNALAEAGIHPVANAEDAPDVVVQGTSRTISWPDLAEAVYAINAGAHHIATNLDATMPTERGIALGNGALVKAVTHATGVEPVYVAGKPDPRIFQRAAERGRMRRPVVVGDRLDTDIAGANNAGFPGLVVLTGVVHPPDILRAAPHERPTYIARDLRGLHVPHPEVEERPEGWRCGGATARLEGHDLLLAQGGTAVRVSGSGGAVHLTLDGLRAAAAAAWSAPSPLDFDRPLYLEE